jgi:hypothetical protein
MSDEASDFKESSEKIIEEIKNGKISFEEGKRIILAEARNEQQRLKYLLEKIDKDSSEGDL